MLHNWHATQICMEQRYRQLWNTIQTQSEAEWSNPHASGLLQICVRMLVHCFEISTDLCKHRTLRNKVFLNPVVTLFLTKRYVQFCKTAETEPPEEAVKCLELNMSTYTLEVTISNKPICCLFIWLAHVAFQGCGTLKLKVIISGLSRHISVLIWISTFNQPYK